MMNNTKAMCNKEKGFRFLSASRFLLGSTLLFCTLILTSACSILEKVSEDSQTKMKDICQYRVVKGIAELQQTHSERLTFMFFPGDIVFQIDKSELPEHIGGSSFSPEVGNEYKAEKLELTNAEANNCKLVLFRIIK